MTTYADIRQELESNFQEENTVCLSIVTHEHDTIASRYVLSMRSPNVLRQMHGQRGRLPQRRWFCLSIQSPRSLARITPSSRRLSCNCPLQEKGILRIAAALRINRKIGNKIRCVKALAINKNVEHGGDGERNRGLIP